MSTIISPNMSLPIPTVGDESGPYYALDINTCLSIIDQHTHTAGQGAPITTAALNINTALTLNNNFLTTVSGVTFSAQNSPPSDVGTVYESGVDLYYVDGLGNNVRITQSGGIAGSPGSIANLTSPASASYVSADATFVWQSDSSTPANMDAASYILRNLTANSKGLTLNPPNAMGANYSLVLPSLPLSTKIMTLDASGNIVAITYVDNTTIEISSNNLQVKDASIGTAKLANQAVTSAKIANLTIVGGNIAPATIDRTKLTAVNPQTSPSCGSFQVSTLNSYVPVGNLSVTITTTGRPVQIFVQGDTADAIAGRYSFMGLTQVATPGNDSEAVFAIFRGGQILSTSKIQLFTSFGDTRTVAEEQGNLSFLDTPGAGTQTYTVQVLSNAVNGAGNPSVICAYKNLVAYELF